MPIPKKNTNETNDEFIGRCMADEVMQEYNDKQRLAICENQISNTKKKEMKKNKRHVKEIIEDKETITIVYEKDEHFEGIKVKEGDRPDEGDEETIEEYAEHIEEEIEEEDEGEEIEDEIEEEEKGIWRSSGVKEKRFYTIETRIKKEGKKNVIEGHAAVYDMLSEDLGGFREIIKKGAFDSVITNDVRAYFNHDPNYILGRTGAGTLKLSTTEKGLKYTLDVPDTSAGRDLVVSMKRGDITQSSFAFQVAQDSWHTDDSLGEIRTIESVKRLYDVSPVSLPAYPDANDIAVAQRGYYIYKDKQKIEAENNYEIKRSLLKLKINILKRK